MKLTQLCQVASVFAFSFGVQAAVITANSSIDFPIESISETVTDSSSSHPGSVYTDVSAYGGEYGPMANASGDSSGAFRLRAGGSGFDYKARSSFSYQGAFTNTTSVTQNAFLDLHFDSGSLEAAFFDVTSSSADLEIRAQVFVNGLLQWETGALMNADSSSTFYDITYYGAFASHSSIESNGVGNGGLNWNAHNYNINLGLIDALTTFDLTYIVSVYAMDYGTDGYSYTHAGMGDPFNISFINSLSYSLPGSGVSVSEPSSLALLGFGLYLLRLKRRR